MTAVVNLNSVSLFRGCSEVICTKHSTRSLASEKRSLGLQPLIVLPIYWVTLYTCRFRFLSCCSHRLSRLDPLSGTVD